MEPVQKRVGAILPVSPNDLPAPRADYRAMLEEIESMIMEARAKGVFLRVFDVRYATAGIPYLGKDFITFPAGSYEVMETGSLQGPSQSVSLLKFRKMVPLQAVLLVELCEANKPERDNHVAKKQ